MKFFPYPYGDRYAASRLRAPLCGILTALLLFACVSAQAQWTRGNTYYGASFVTTVTPYTTDTKTASGGTAAIGLKSVPINNQNGYVTSGNLYGNAYQDFTWTGPQPQADFQVAVTESYSGSITSGSASSSAQSTAGSHSGATSQPYTLSYSGIYNPIYVELGGNSGVATDSYWISVQTQVYYSNSGSATAMIKWGNPVPTNL